MELNISILKSILVVVLTMMLVLGFGLIALSVYDFFTIIIPGLNLHIALYVQIFIGSFVALTSILAYFLLCQDLLNLTYVCSLFMVISIALEIYLLIVHDSTGNIKMIRGHLEKFWSDTDLFASEISQIEQEHQCCGLRKLGVQEVFQVLRNIPKNCFRNLSGLANDLFTASCLDVIENTVRMSGEFGWPIKIALLVFELLGLLFCCLIGVAMRQMRRRLTVHESWDYP